MKTMTWIASTLLIVLSACNDSAPAPTSAKVEKSKAAISETSVAATGDQTNRVSPSYKNGTNDQNKGDKTGSVRLHGNIAVAPGSMMYLYVTEARNKALLDSAEVEGGIFNFPNLEVGRGFYELVLNGKANNNTQIILNPDESDVYLEFKSPRLTGNKLAPKSRENTAWFNYIKLENKNKNEIQNLRKGLKDSPYRARIEEQIRGKELELVQTQHDMMDQYAGSYFAKVLSWKNPMYPSSQGKYFEDMNPLDNSLIHTLAISDRIQGMMVKFSKGEDSGFLACIDIIKAHFEPNPKTLESALYAMLDGFYNTGKEDICQYILDNYIFDEDCGADLSDVIRQRAQGIINLQVGKTPPNFNIEAFSGGKVNLMKTAAENQYTLVMFWASWCHKCEQEIPVLIPLYARYGNKGFEAIGVSIDASRKSWADVIEGRGMQYLNVSQLQGWDSPIVKDYKITSTPTYFLLDNKGEIVLKPKRIFEVDAFLTRNMK
jgi:thiol-disulfide isomerase/thioredoxin